MNDLLLVRSILEGAAGFFAYCVWPLIPGYLGLVVGAACADQARAGGTRNGWKMGVAISLSFIVGFVMSFSLLGVYGSGHDSLLGSYTSVIKRGGGLLVGVSAIYLFMLTIPRCKAAFLSRHPRKSWLHFAGFALGAAL